MCGLTECLRGMHLTELSVCGTGQERHALLIPFATTAAAAAAADCRCTSGCSCEPRKDIDALHSLHQSTIYLVRLLVTQSEECEISITLSDKTRSEGHKFKVCGTATIVTMQPGQGTMPLIRPVYNVASR
jgi:hypothetical protein